MDWAGTTRNVAAVVLTLVAMGCDKDKGAQPPETPAPATSEAPRTGSDQLAKIAVGDEVVVESGTATFWAGKVVEISNAKVTYEYGSNRSKGEANQDRVYVLAPNRKTVARADDLAICKTEPSTWNACEIKRVERDVFVVDDPWGESHNLTSEEVVYPNEQARERIKEKLDKASTARVFVSAAQAAGSPRRPDGWVPRPGDEVVAKFSDSSWHGGRIRRLTPTKIHVAWDDKSSPSERDYDEVAPKPDKPFESHEGQFVLARPGRGTRWDYFRVERIGDHGVVLVDKDGGKRTVKNGDLIPLGPKQL